MDETRSRDRQKSPYDYKIRLKLAFLGGLGIKARRPLYECIDRWLSEPQKATESVEGVLAVEWDE